MQNIKIISFGLLGALCAPAVYAFQVGGFDLTPTATIQEKYDDNISSSGTNIKDDFITLFTLGLNGAYETKTDSLKLSGSITQKVFAKEHDFNTVSELLGAKYKKEFSEHDRITFNDSFTHADESTSFKDEFGRASGRYDYYKNICDLGLEHDFTEQFTAKLKYANEFYDPTINTVSRSILNKPGVELDYAFSSKTIGSMFYDYSNRVFDPGGTVSIHSTAVGVRRFLSSNIYVDAKSGADFIHTIDDTDTVRPSYSLGLTDELDETSHAGISFTKSYNVNYFSKDLFNSWSVALNWGKQLAQRLYFYTGAFTGAGKFSGGSKENFYGLNLGFDYEFRSNMKAVAGYSFTRRDSSVSRQDYDKNTVTLGMTIDF